MDQPHTKEPFSPAKGKAYRYKPLETSQPHIRLIRLLPRTSTGQIRLEIKENVPLQRLRSGRTRHAYRALSYEWGPPGNEKLVMVNDGSEFAVRENLYLFLSALIDCHDGLKLGWLWTDAICIDQSNIPERNIQVLQMKLVYSLTTEVLAWIGTSTHGDVQTVFRLMDRFGQTMYVSYEQDLTDWQGRYGEFGPDDILANPASLLTLIKLCQCGYWRRMWIVQELVLATKVSVICDSYQTKLISFLGLSLCLNLIDLFNKTDVPSDLLDQARNLFSIKSLLRLIMGDDWIGTVTNSVHLCIAHDCGLLHDKVYGILGLVKTSTSLTVDYRTPILDLFTSVLSSAGVDTNWTELLSLALTLELKAELSEPGKTILIKGRTDSQVSQHHRLVVTYPTLSPNQQSTIKHAVTGPIDAQEQYFCSLIRASPLHSTLIASLKVYAAQTSSTALVCESCPNTRPPLSRLLNIIAEFKQKTAKNTRGKASNRKSGTEETGSDANFPLVLTFHSDGQVADRMRYPTLQLLFDHQGYVVSIIENDARDKILCFHDPSHESWHVKQVRKGISPSEWDGQIVWSSFSHLYPLTFLCSGQIKNPDLGRYVVFE